VAAARVPSATRDPEFATATATMLEPGDLDEAMIAPESYLRVVANPFLGFAGLAGWLIALVWVFRHLRENPHLIGPIAPFIAAVFLGCLWLIPGLFQFHCLDCGRSDRLSRWRRHTCPTSALRRLQGRPRRLRGPTPPGQVLLWLWLILTLGIVLARLGVDWRSLVRALPDVVGRSACAMPGPGRQPAPGPGTTPGRPTWFTIRGETSVCGLDTTVIVDSGHASCYQGILFSPTHGGSGIPGCESPSTCPVRGV
jgi:hypothetical protein